MKMLRAAVLFSLAAKMANAQTVDPYSQTEQRNSRDAYDLIVSFSYDVPNLLVRFENPLGKWAVAGVSFQIEWTANGVLQSTDLWDDAGARCVGNNSGLFCSALTNWFNGTNTARRPTPVRVEEFPQGFSMDNLEYGVRYCFRLKASTLAPNIPGVFANTVDWSRWTCARAPAAPPPVPLPPAPSQPNLTMLPASDGRGVEGGPIPVRLLIEWEIPGDVREAHIDGYYIEASALNSVQPVSYERIKIIKTSQTSGEATIAFDGPGPTQENRSIYRVCTFNKTGRACSPGKATSPFNPGPLAPRSGRTVEFPTQPGTTTSATAEGGETLAKNPPICDMAAKARARNSPATAGLEEQCRKAGGTVAANTPVVTQPGGTVKAQGRVNLNATPAASATGATAIATAGPEVVARQPENTIDVRVRYRRELGYKTSDNAFGKLGQTSCSAFVITASFADGSRPRDPMPINIFAAMETAGDFYVCNYRISDIPLDKEISVSAYVGDADRYARWQGGTMVQPPDGQWRTILDSSRSSSLDSSQPRARISFDMVFAPVTQR